MSYYALPAQAQFLYRRFGDHPSPRATVDAAAAMLDTGTNRARKLLEVLRDAGMVDEHDAGYTLPTADQEHARTLADREDEPRVRKDTRSRVIERAYLPQLIEADYILNPGPHHYNPAYVDLESGARQSRFSSPKEAMTWFIANMGTLRGLIRQAHDDKNFTAVWQLAEASRGGHLKGRCNNWLVETHEVAVEAALKCRSPWASIGHSRLSSGYRNTGRVDEAIAIAVTARRLAVNAGDEWAESAAWSAEGRGYFAAEEYHLALERYLQSLLIAERINDARSVALRIRHMAECYFAMNKYAEACQFFEGAATRMKSIGFRDGLAMVIVLLADARIAVGQADEAIDELHDALAIMDESGSDAYVAEVFARLAAVSEKLGRTADARRYSAEADSRFAAINDRDSLIEGEQ
ncbi:hypothetical protein SAMN05216215_101867 [Saccharopolyspora shandongensis]|uniref:Uncharacterized protein n=1 Tax=Saccharopolyspora shandongensis TaxID=418495 RepID=A0A1H3G785_9PSEU|nr:tetratricopeptide repeat protein [Saccharopolyspora shandongensis]SDX98910.1 hypothetical protein SAMN05216215_101867 [Saccharopolyspora shandongensis]